MKKIELKNVKFGTGLSAAYREKRGGREKRRRKEPPTFFANIRKCGRRIFFFWYWAPIFCKSSAFDPKTDNLQETCKKSTKAEPVFPPPF